MDLGGFLQNYKIDDYLYHTVYGDVIYKGLVDSGFFEDSGELISKLEIKLEIPNNKQIKIRIDGKFEDSGECLLFPSKTNRNWLTLPYYGLRSFDKVIIRYSLYDNPEKYVIDESDESSDIWRCDTFSHYFNDDEGNFNEYKYITSGGIYKECLPYEGNEYLVGSDVNPFKI